MGKKKKLKKAIEKRELEDEPALVICVGKKCCERKYSCALYEAARTYAEGHAPHVHVLRVDCLDICKKGPIAASYPTMKFKKRVDETRARKMLDKLEARHRRDG